jgi:hypothetical protein
MTPEQILQYYDQYNIPAKTGKETCFAKDESI